MNKFFKTFYITILLIVLILPKNLPGDREDDIIEVYSIETLISN